MKRGSRLPALFLGAAAVAAAVGLTYESRPAMRLLPGGMKIGILGATRGDEEMATDAVWKRLLRRTVAPPGTTSAVGADWCRPGLPADWVVVWGRWEAHYEAFSMPGPIGTQFPGYAAAVVDSHGLEYSSSSRSGASPSLEGQRWAALEYWPFERFPRRARELRLRLTPIDPRKRSWPVVEATVRNPVVGEYPQWARNPVPVRANAGDLEATLEELVSGLPQPGRAVSRTEAARSRMWTRARLSFRQTGRSAPWAPIAAEVADATGNRWPWSGILSKAGSDGGVLMVPHGLSPDEPAFRLRFELTRQAGFAADELWTSPPMPIGHGTADAPGPLRFNRGGVRMALNGYDSPAVGARIEPTEVTLHFFDDVGPDVRARARLVRAIDQQRRALRVQPTPVRDDETSLVYLFWPDRKSRAARLTFAVTRSRFVEMTATPTWVGR
jgi:hypothetical protein